MTEQQMTVEEAMYNLVFEPRYVKETDRPAVCFMVATWHVDKPEHGYSKEVPIEGAKWQTYKKIGDKKFQHKKAFKRVKYPWACMCRCLDIQAYRSVKRGFLRGAENRDAMIEGLSNCYHMIVGVGMTPQGALRNAIEELNAYYTKMAGKV